MLQKILGALLRKLFHSNSSEKPEKIQSTLFTSFGAMTTSHTQKVFQTHLRFTISRQENISLYISIEEGVKNSPPPVIVNMRFDYN